MVSHTCKLRYVPPQSKSDRQKSSNTEAATQENPRRSCSTAGCLVSFTNLTKTAGRANMEGTLLLDSEPLLRNHYAWASLLLLVVLSVSLLLLQQKSGNELIDVPIVGSRQSWIARWMFFSDASMLITEGYSKARLFSGTTHGSVDKSLVQDGIIQAQWPRHGYSADKIHRRAPQCDRR